jgi:asparagine synthase (glutamine-hydrolysing)
MIDKTSGIVLVFNGELYNYIELRAELAGHGHRFASTSDTEVLLRAYLEWGRAAFGRFIGMWAVALYDPRSRELVLSRDRFGIKPLFVHGGPGRLVFGSTATSVLAASGVSRRWNARTVERFLVHRSVDESQESFFAGLQHFPPASHAVMNLDDPVATLRFERYWDTGVNNDMSAASHSFPDACAEFRERLFDSVRLHTRSDVEVSSCLSGGLDSSALVCALARIPEGASINKVFSAIFPGRDYDEDRYSGAVADQYGLKRYKILPDAQTFLADIERVVEAQEEPFGSTGVYVQWKVFEAIHGQGIKVAIDGQGADEYLGGYFSFLVPYAMDCLARGNLAGALRAWASYRRGNRFRHHIWQNLPALMARLFGAGNGVRKSPFAAYLAPGLSDSGGTTDALQVPDIDAPVGRGLKRTLVRYLTRYSLPALLRYEDRNSMYFSIESRVPFLDHRLVEYALSLPDNYLIDGRTTKHVMRASVRGIVPVVVHARTDKIGFGNPEAEWVDALVRGGLLHDLLAGPAAADLVDVVGVRRLLKIGNATTLDHNFLWRLYSLLAWQRWAFR